MVENEDRHGGQAAACPGRVEGVIGVIERDGRYLMIRRSASVLAPGAWCFPGGGIGAGETEQEALVRELREELGVEGEPLEKCWEWVRADGRLRLHWWRARICGSDLRPNPDEVAEAIWATREEILALEPLLPNNREFLAREEQKG